MDKKFGLFRRGSLAARAASPARRDGLPQQHAARTGAAMRGLDMWLRRRDAEGPGVFRGEGLGAGRREKLGGLDFDVLKVLCRTRDEIGLE